MGKHIIVGAGPVGGAVAKILVERGDQAVVVTRSGTQVAGAEAVRADATDAARLSDLASGAVAIYNCVNPPYDQWATAWPPIAAALLGAAEATGAVLATTGNLYVYGRVDAPITETTPMRPNGPKGEVRKQMWLDALAAHERGNVRTFEVRGSDYLGGNSLLATLIAPRLRAGKRAFVPADLDAPHSWTNVLDVADLLITGAGDDRAWGRAWHVPTADACSTRELTTLAARQLGAKAKVTALPYAALWAAGLTNSFVRELRETQHQFRAPFVLDSSDAQRTFGLRPRGIEQSVALDLAADVSATATNVASHR